MSLGQRPWEALLHALQNLGSAELWMTLLQGC